MLLVGVRPWVGRGRVAARSLVWGACMCVVCLPLPLLGLLEAPPGPGDDLADRGVMAAGEGYGSGEKETLRDSSFGSQFIRLISADILF